MNLNLELTDHCNLKCRMCSQSLRDEAHGVPMRFMSFETWRKALQGLQNSKEAVDLCPHWLGEPTLHPQFDLFVEYAFAVNQRNRIFRSFKLHTNAVIFSADRARRLIRLANLPDQAPDTFRAIHFSIDAFSPQSYTWIKGADHREKVFRNVARFLQIRNELSLQRPVAHIAFVVQDGNHQEVRDFVEFWRPKLGNHTLTSDWPSFDQDALYLRRWNTGDQARADRLHRDALLIPGNSSGGSASRREFLMWFLLGCTSQLVGPAGPETVRASLLFEEEDRSWVLLANSYVPCTVDTPDDPTTIQDEAAIAIAYRSAQIGAALTREGAMVVVLDMPGEGEWQVGGENWGAWYFVEEAMRYGQDGMIATYLPTVVQKNLDVRSGQMTLEEGRGSFLFEEDGVSGRFVVEACDDPILRQQILSHLSSAGSIILN